MSVATLVTIHCDTCGSAGSELGAAATADEARRILAGRGWQVNVPNRAGDGRRLDFCPAHRTGQR